MTGRHISRRVQNKGRAEKVAILKSSGKRLVIASTGHSTVR